MILDARGLSTFQVCPIRWVFGETMSGGKWHPKTLFDAVLRKGILELSFGVPREAVALQAITQFRTLAKSPGLDTLGDPWTLAGDYCVCLETILEKLSRVGLSKLELGPTVELDPDLQWMVSAFKTPETLHRWATVERLDSDHLAREAHSWHVLGDMAVTGLPLALHLIEIGAVRSGRRRSPWCQTFQHPVIMGKFQFKSRTGELKGNWKPVWYGPNQDPKIWVDLMGRDKLDLLRDVSMKKLEKPDRDRILWEIRSEARNMVRATAEKVLPRRFPACDFPVPCTWQWMCFGASEGVPNSPPNLLGDD